MAVQHIRYILSQFNESLATESSAKNLLDAEKLEWKLENGLHALSFQVILKEIQFSKCLHKD